ncbi:MAG: glycosyltransferase involved in cell wall biosynthesis, partial [Verrucomicrobiales bacterium]
MRNRSIKVVHLIESLSQSNHGVIEAALATSTDLKNRHGIDSEVWAPVLPGDPKPNLRTAALFPIDPSRARSAIEMAGDRNLNPTTTVVASHGCWQWPTRTAATLRRAGFSWVYSPHGMLEPWSLGQKRLRKWIFWKMIEGRRAKLANVVRATSTPEAKNLSQRFDQVEMIPHGVELPTDSNSAAAGGTDPVRVVFMGRLHPKKGVLPLARAWLASELANLAGFELV